MKPRKGESRRVRELTIAGLRACGWYKAGNYKTYSTYRHRRSKRTYYVGLAGALRWKPADNKQRWNTISLTDSAIHHAYQRVGELYEDGLIDNEHHANEQFKQELERMQNPSHNPKLGEMKP